MDARADATPTDNADDIARRIEVVYEAIAAGPMADMPVCNPALGVEAVGFRCHGDGFLGVVITPWFMNLTLVPDAPSPGLRAGEKENCAFPAGRFEFVHGELDGFGRVLTCSLYSPMFEFDDPAVARATANAALSALMDAANIEDPAAPEPSERHAVELEAARAVDRRRFLRGEFARVRT